MTQRTGFRAYDSFQGIETIGNHWTANKEGRVMQCVLTTHPLGWELRLSVGNTFMRSQVCKTQDEVFDVGEAWQAEAKGKGWN